MYFFIDPAQLPATQDVADAYGPRSGNLANKYAVTSRFDLSAEAKAFACQTGMMVVQQSVVDDSLVNVIIKPNDGLSVGINVKYYVYRGILKNSLIGTDTCIIGQDPSNNQLVERIWLDPPSEPDCGTLGFMDSDDTTPITEDVERIFDYDIAGVDPILVNEGEWFGTFSDSFKIGFEVVLESNRFKATLEYVRAEEHEIDVTGLTNYAERIKREEILDFIDPAAFFGLHFTERVSYYDTAGTNDTRKTTTTAGTRFIYTKLISKFRTANKVYLDIRSEKGYSYNLYQNYKVSNADSDNIDIRVNTAYATQAYGTNSWPILILESAHTSGSTNSLRLKLRIGNNTKPIIYTKTTLKKSLNNSTGITSRYIKTDDLIDNGNNPDHTDWTNEFRLYFPNTLAPNRNYISNYVKLNYFRSEHNAAALSPVLLNENYYDSAFCSVDIPNIGNITNNKRFVEGVDPICVREPNNTDGTGNFQLNMSNGAYWDEDRVLFYAVIEYENSSKVSEKQYLNTYPQKFEFASCSYFNEYCDSELYKRTEIICREYNPTVGATRIPGINFYKSENASVGIRKNYKENAMLLGLTLEELEAIKDDTQIDSTAHQRFIHLVPSTNNPITDTNNNRHFEYEVQLQGINANGQRTIVTPQYNNAPITLYSRDNQFFSSREFSNTIPLTSGQNGQNQANQIEFHIYEDGVVKTNDNIDYALVHDIERVYYKYHDAADVITDLCDLDLVMADKMKRKSGNSGRITNMNAAPHNFPTAPFVDYQSPTVHPGVDAEESFRNAASDIATTPRVARPNNTPPVTASSGGIRKYINQKKKVFLVNFETASVNNATLGINITYENTLRHYANPGLAAAMMGALIDVTHATTCQGFAYQDASCYPSYEHVNGEAADTDYNSTTQEDVDYILALYKYGFDLFRIGNTYHARSNNIYNHASLANIRTTVIRRDANCRRLRNNETADCNLQNGVYTRKKVLSSLHSSHLHTSHNGGVKLKDGNKTL
ncbi:hypothetical protein [Kordia sp.]|uniref:hypothetical protein n=1 Tax=Kordia sp. TaxID=1965332 RepID=UPI003B5B457E